MSGWGILIVAGLLEVCWVVGMKYSHGFTRIIPSVFTLCSLLGSMYLLAKAVKYLPLGTAYAVWVGIGVVGASVLGVMLFKEPVTGARVLFLLLLVISLVGLKVTTQ